MTRPARWPLPVNAPFVFSALAIVAAVACTSLDPATPNVCGNGAVEDGEDCDGSSALGTCGAAGDANACHFVCANSATCPGGYGCGVDGRCREPSGTFAPAPAAYPLQVSGLRAGDVDGDGYADLTGIEGDRIVTRYSNAAADLAQVSSQSVPTLTGSVGYGDLDGDGLQDVVMPTAVGLSSLLGTSDRVLTPFPYATVSFLGSTGAITVQAVARDASFPLQTPLLTEFDSLAVGGGAPHVVHNGMHFFDATSAWVTCLDGAANGSAVSTLVYVGADATDATADCPGSASYEDLLEDRIVTGRLGANQNMMGSGSGLSAGFVTGVTSATDTTDEAVLAESGKTYVEVMTMSSVMVTGTADASTSAFRFLEKVTLAPSGSGSGSATTVATDGAIGIADLDGDGYNDLAIPSTNNLAGTVFSLAFNNKNGSVGSGSAALPVFQSAFKATTGNSGQPLPIGKPRLFVDVNADGKADVVTDEQIFITTCTSATVTCGGLGSVKSVWTGSALAATTRAWTTAVALDINHDGIVDIAGFIAGSPDVDVMLGAGSLLFNRFTIATGSPVKAITVGDFDGDLVEDIAIVTGVPDATAEVDSLAVAFGAANGGPSAPVAMGTYGTVLGIDSVSVTLAVDAVDATTDLVVVNQRADGTRGAALVLGSSSRQMVASYYAPDETEVRLGAYDTNPGTDVITFGADGSLTAYQGLGDGDIQYESSSELATLGSGCYIGSGSGACTNLTGGPSCPGAGTFDVTYPTLVDPANGDCTFTGACAPAGACTGAGNRTLVRGACSGTIARSCTTTMPVCPAGTFASEQNGCWDGYCLTEAQCLIGTPAPIVSASAILPDAPARVLMLHSIAPADLSKLTGSNATAFPIASGSGSGTGPGSCALTDLTIAEVPAASAPAGTPWKITGPTELPANGCRHSFALGVRDYDGDGADDLLLTLCATPAGCDYGESFIAWGSAGGFDVAGAVAVDPSDPTLQCSHLQPIQLDTDAPLELVGICTAAKNAAAATLPAGSTSAHIFDLGTDGRTWTDIGSFPLGLANNVLVSADFNGDGLADFATQSGTTSGDLTQIFLQCAVGDASCAAIPEVQP